MKLANLIGDRFRETPSDCVVESHALMLRGGYIKYVANGIYSSLPPLCRITRKIEQIIREEMDARRRPGGAVSRSAARLLLAGIGALRLRRQRAAAFYGQERVPPWCLA